MELILFLILCVICWPLALALVFFYAVALVLDVVASIRNPDRHRPSIAEWDDP